MKHNAVCTAVYRFLASALCGVLLLPLLASCGGGGGGAPSFRGGDRFVPARPAG